jgi:hypothetical protein
MKRECASVHAQAKPTAVHRRRARSFAAVRGTEPAPNGQNVQHRPMLKRDSTIPPRNTDEDQRHAATKTVQCYEARSA